MEQLPARARGWVDLSINGSYWMGAAAGAALSGILLDTSIFPADIGWRLAFFLGAILGIGIMLVRRYVPESPRWLRIHRRPKEAERLVAAGLMAFAAVTALIFGVNAEQESLEDIAPPLAAEEAAT